VVTNQAVGFGRISAPIIREAAAIGLWHAALEFRELGMQKNSLIDFRMSYNCVWMNCWPRIAHSLLLLIGSVGPTPSKLLNVFTHKTLSFMGETVEQLKRMEISQVVFVESVIAHSLTLNVTGFPCSPRPRR
jgi:hypothetical protein